MQSSEQQIQEAPATIAWPGLARPFASNGERALVVLAFAALVALRFPTLLAGRFWAEEGKVFYYKAWAWPFWEALLAPHSGYLNLTANVAALLARYFVPPVSAPLVTTAIALAIQCLPIILLLQSRMAWLQSRAVILLAAFLVLSCPASEEVWLNSINSMNHLALAAGIILALETRGGAVGIFHGAVLLLASLSSPAAWLLAPLFVLRALVERSKPRAIQAAIVFAGIALELLFFFSENSSRSIGASLPLIGGILFLKHLVLPLLGREWTAVLVPGYAAQFTETQAPLWPLLVLIAVFAGAVALAFRSPKKTPLWFLLGGATMAFGSQMGSLGYKLGAIHVFAGARYTFAPQILFGLALLSWSVMHAGRTRLIGQLVCVWLVVVNFGTYFSSISPMFTDGPSWREEVKKWNRDPAYLMDIWPRGWKIPSLSKPAPRS